MVARTAKAAAARRIRNSHMVQRTADGGRGCLGRGGFSLIEIMMAIVVLTVGLLGLAGTTGFILRQTSLSGVTTDRSWAQQNVMERLRAMDLADVGSGSETYGDYSMEWTLTEDTRTAKTVRLTTTGPGLGRIGGFAALTPSVTDTITFQIIDLRP